MLANLWYKSQDKMTLKAVDTVTSMVDFILEKLGLLMALVWLAALPEADHQLGTVPA